MYEALIERFKQNQSERIKVRYLSYLKESEWHSSSKLKDACVENESYFKTGVPMLTGFSVPLILRYDLHDCTTPLMELVLVYDIRRSNRGAVLKGYSPLYDEVIYYREEDITSVRQGATNAPIASFDTVMQLYEKCADPGYAELRAELNALLYLSLRDSVMQPCEIEVVKKYIATKQLPAEMEKAFQFYFETSFITPDAYEETLTFIRTLPQNEREALIAAGYEVISASGGISAWEKQAFEALLEVA